MPIGWNAGRSKPANATGPREWANQIVGRHERAFGRDKTIFGPLHYIPVLARKPGALRNGAPFKEWELPGPIRRVWRKLERQPGGNRQMVDILSAVLTDSLDAVEAACAEALTHNVHSAGPRHCARTNGASMARC